MIKSRFSWVTYLFLFFILFLIAVVVFAIARDISAPALKKTPQSDNWRIVGVMLITLVLVYIFARFALVIRVTSSQIIIRGLLKRKIIERASINSIDLFGESRDFTKGSNAIRISLVNEKDIVIVDAYYSNSHKIKPALNDHFKEKIKDHSIPVPPKTRNQWHSEKFAGNFHTSEIGIMLYLFLAGAIALLLFVKEINLIMPGLICWLVFSFAISIQAYYFELDGRDLIIRHHIFRWISKRYSLNEILFVKFEQRFKQSNSAVIFTRNFRRRSYAGGNLRGTHWLALKAALESTGIPVKNTFSP